MLFDILKKYTDLATNTYHVNPWIFVGLIILSLPFFYGSFFIITKELYNYKKKKVMNNKRLKGAMIVCFVSYIAPYVYVILFGNNLPWWFWLFIILVISFSIYSFFKSVVKPVNDIKEIKKEK